VTIKVSTGEATPLGPTRLYTATSASPDGRYLLVSWLERPYSYSLPCGRFPKRVQLWDRDGKLVREIAALPLAEDIPVAFDSCRKGPRGIEWRDDKPAEMSWMECQDGGDPAVAASPRDIVFVLDADAAADPAVKPRAIAGTDMRCRGVSWGTGSFALLYEAEWKSRRSVTWVRGGGGGCQAAVSVAAGATGRQNGDAARVACGSRALGGQPGILLEFAESC
jgi:hypothetical protein